MMTRTIRSALAAALLAVAALALAAPAQAAVPNPAGLPQPVAAHLAHRPHSMLWPMCWTNGNGAAHWKWRGDELIRHCYRR